jgi:antitoxin component YwqK of YwqJK toxin-antitoxin module
VIKLGINTNNCKTNMNRKNIMDKTYAYYRTSRAYVLDIYHRNFGIKQQSAVSNYSDTFIYKLHEYIEEPIYNCDENEISTYGIHFFLTEEQALNWNKDSFFISKIYNDTHKTWYSNGMTRYIEYYLKGKLHGNIIYYNNDGQIMMINYYENGELINTKYGPISL